MMMRVGWRCTSMRAETLLDVQHLRPLGVGDGDVFEIDGGGRPRTRAITVPQFQCPPPTCDVPAHLGEHALHQLAEALAPEVDRRADRDHGGEHDQARARVAGDPDGLTQAGSSCHSGMTVAKLNPPIALRRSQ